MSKMKNERPVHAPEKETQNKDDYEGQKSHHSRSFRKIKSAVKRVSRSLSPGRKSAHKKKMSSSSRDLLGAAPTQEHSPKQIRRGLKKHFIGEDTESSSSEENDNRQVRRTVSLGSSRPRSAGEIFKKKKRPPVDSDDNLDKRAASFKSKSFREATSTNRRSHSATRRSTSSRSDSPGTKSAHRKQLVNSDHSRSEDNLDQKDTKPKSKSLREPTSANNRSQSASRRSSRSVSPGKRATMKKHHPRSSDLGGSEHGSKSSARRGLKKDFMAIDDSSSLRRTVSLGSTPKLKSNSSLGSKPKHGHGDNQATTQSERELRTHSRSISPRRTKTHPKKHKPRKDTLSASLHPSDHSSQSSAKAGQKIHFGGKKDSQSRPLATAPKFKSTSSLIKKKTPHRISEDQPKKHRPKESSASPTGRSSSSSHRIVKKKYNGFDDGSTFKSVSLDAATPRPTSTRNVIKKKRTPEEWKQPGRMTKETAPRKKSEGKSLFKGTHDSIGESDDVTEEVRAAQHLNEPQLARPKATSIRSSQHIRQEANCVLSPVLEVGNSKIEESNSDTCTKNLSAGAALRAYLNSAYSEEPTALENAKSSPNLPEPTPPDEESQGTGVEETNLLELRRAVIQAKEELLAAEYEAFQQEGDGCIDLRIVALEKKEELLALERTTLEAERAAFEKEREASFSAVRLATTQLLQALIDDERAVFQRERESHVSEVEHLKLELEKERQKNEDQQQVLNILSTQLERSGRVSLPTNEKLLNLSGLSSSYSELMLDDNMFLDANDDNEEDEDSVMQNSVIQNPICSAGSPWTGAYLAT